MNTVTRFEMLDKLLAAAASNGVYEKRVKDVDYLLNRYECALLCQNVFHLTNRPSGCEDVPEGDRYYGAVGAVLSAGIMQAQDGRFGGCEPVSEQQADEIAQAAGAYQKKLRGSFRPFKTTALQFNPKMYDNENNIARLYKEVEKAFQEGARLVVAPEVSTSAYVYEDRVDIGPYVETIPGKSTEILCELTKKYNGYLSYGIAEVEPSTGHFFNSGVLLGPGGYIGKYRKTHQWETEKHWSVDGNLGVPVFSTELGNLAMIICIDTTYYEVSRLAAMSGADVILYLTCDSGQAIWAVPPRAAQNGVYIVSANRSGQEKTHRMVGGSAVWGPRGDKLAEGEVVLPGETATFETQHVSAMIDPARYDNENKQRLWKRKPELYKELALTITPWDKRKSTEKHPVNALALQYEPSVGDVGANRATIEKMVTQGYKKDALINLLVLPEFSLTGPVEQKPDVMEALAEELSGPTVQFFAKLAAKHKAVVVFTMAERAGESLYHTCVVLENDGTVLGIYRKMHLNESEQRWAKPGTRVQSFCSKEIGRIGVIVGDEYLFPEIYGLLQVKRADLIAMPQAYVSGGGIIEADRRIVARDYRENAVMLWDSIAIGVQAYLVVANYVGTEKKYAGGSGLYTLEPIYGKDIPALAGQQEEGVIVRFETLAAETWWMNQEKMVATRRAVHYDPLMM